MATVKKNVNLVLILLFLVAIGSVVGATVYYQITYKNLTEQYNQKVSDLEQTRANLTKQQQNLLSTQTELNLRVEDRSKIEGLYNELLTAKNQLDKDLSLTRGQLASTQATLSDTKVKLDEANAKLASTLKDLETQKTLAAAYLKQRDDLCAQVKASNSTVSC
ncbi:MAG: hypothetical protein EPN86_05805 [Nanoarchaeota archaeon]|nr:MAG: hypothetical protein EPN86_05805 [Nanoarchaeota archaeon]